MRTLPTAAAKSPSAFSRRGITTKSLASLQRSDLGPNVEALTRDVFDSDEVPSTFSSGRDSCAAPIRGGLRICDAGRRLTLATLALCVVDAWGSIRFQRLADATRAMGVVAAPHRRRAAPSDWNGNVTTTGRQIAECPGGAAVGVLRAIRRARSARCRTAPRQPTWLTVRASRRAPTACRESVAASTLLPP